MGVLAGLLGCVFGVLGILTWGIFFVPLAALCAIVGLLRGIVGGSAAGIGTSLLAGILAAIGFATSPSLWLLTAGLIGAALPDQPSTPAHRADTAAKPAPSKSPPSGRVKGPDQLTDVQLFYEYGHTAQVERRYDDALEWYRKAADLGSDRAQYDLGIIYEQGHGVPQNLDEAVKWYRMAADQGNAGARDKLALLNPGQRKDDQDRPEPPLSAEKQNTKPESTPNNEESTVPGRIALSLQCTPEATSSTNPKDPIVTVVISLQGQDWRVTHIAASGARHERNAQYLIHDVSNSEAATWEGKNLTRAHLKMVGQVFSAGSGSGKFTYVEKIYDANSGGRQTYEGRASCTTSSSRPTENEIKHGLNDRQDYEQVLRQSEIDYGAKCDQSGANPNDPRKPQNVPGVPYELLRANPKDALDACRNALARFPQEARYKYQFARALDVDEPDKAIPIYKQLIHENYPAAYDNLASIYIRKQNITAAVSVLKSGVTANDPDSMVTLVSLIEQGYLPVGNPTAATFALLQRAAQLGHSGAQRALERKRLDFENEQRKQAFQQQERQMMQNFFGTILRGVGH